MSETTVQFLENAELFGKTAMCDGATNCEYLLTNILSIGEFSVSNILSFFILFLMSEFNVMSWEHEH